MVALRQVRTLPPSPVAVAAAILLIISGLFSFLLYLIAGFDQIACFVGFYFTLAWAMAGLAAVVYWEERNLAPGGGMPAPQAMPPQPPSMPPPPPPPSA